MHSVIVASLAFTTAVGCSVYVTLVFAVFLMLWTGGVFLVRRRTEAASLVCAGVLTALLASPHLRTLTPESGARASGSAAAGAGFFTPSIRTFLPAEILVRSSYPEREWLVHVVNAAFLPLNYLLEFGFFLLIACLVLRRYFRSRQLSREQWALTTLLATSGLVCTFVRSSVISFNDLGWRGLLLAQFVLILWAVEFWPSWPTVGRSMRRWLQIAFVLGALGTVYQGVMLRIYPILVDSGAIARHEWISPDRQLGRRTMAARQAYAALRSTLPSDAIVQFNPMNDVAGYMYGSYAMWQTAAFDASCGTQFGGRSSDCYIVAPDISQMFTPVGDGYSIQTRRIDAVVFQDTDPIWKEPSACRWQNAPLISNPFIRIMSAAEKRDPHSTQQAECIKDTKK